MAACRARGRGWRHLLLQDDAISVRWEEQSPRFDLLDMKKFNRITLQTSRGCPHDCEFCAASKMYGPAYRVKPVQQVMDEIHEIRKYWENPFIEFAGWWGTDHYDPHEAIPGSTSIDVANIYQLDFVDRDMNTLVSIHAPKTG